MRFYPDTFCIPMSVEFFTIEAIFRKYQYNVVFRPVHTEEELKKYQNAPDDMDQTAFFTVLDPRGLTVCRLFSAPNAPKNLQMDELQSLIDNIAQYKITNSEPLVKELKVIWKTKFSTEKN